ncbi:Gfo/Idh/MocA family protein [Microbacterium sp. ZW T2_14]|uniref:Gfo/Idh/MocA family protein n=1 Tax=Microbacterium sp. ZW T2_14 TaxID=3378079 RepID=UPI0038524680
MHGWGIIGTGDISARMAADLGAVAPERVLAVWGRRQDRADAFAREHGIPFATERREELFARADVDVVYIATPAHTHLEIAFEALDAGKHVLVEKPMATSAADVEAIFAKAQATGHFAMEAMWMRFNPLHVDVLERVRSGTVGDVRAVRASFGTPFRAAGTKLTPAHAGSALRDRGIYAVTLAHWFLGDPTAISATGSLMDGVDIAGHATLEHGEGRFAQLAWSGIEFLDLSAAVSGERGWITLDPMFWAGQSARVHAGSVERIFVSPEHVEHPRQGNGYQPMLAAVEEAIAAGRLQHPWHDRDATLAVARSMDAIAAQLPA